MKKEPEIAKKFLGAGPIYPANFIIFKYTKGSVPEWLNGSDCKSDALNGYGGSNPSWPTKNREMMYRQTLPTAVGSPLEYGGSNPPLPTKR